MMASQFLSVEGYGLYITLSYLASAIFVIGTAMLSWRKARQIRKKTQQD